MDSDAEHYGLVCSLTHYYASRIITSHFCKFTKPSSQLDNIIVVINLQKLQQEHTIHHRNTNDSKAVCKV